MKASARHRSGWALACALVLAAASCTRLSDEDAVKVVRAYDRQLVEAFRAGDATLIERVAGDSEAKKITGLVGVKVDQDLFLDAELEEFRVLGVKRSGSVVLVDTEERWYYRDRRIGSGATVGQDSRDRYRIRYTLGKARAGWVVDHLEFRSPPEVGRASGPPLDPRALHGRAASPPAPAPGTASVR
jgi:hypothetical protein